LGGRKEKRRKKAKSIGEKKNQGGKKRGTQGWVPPEKKEKNEKGAHYLLSILYLLAFKGGKREGSLIKKGKGERVAMFLPIFFFLLRRKMDSSLEDQKKGEVFHPRRKGGRSRELGGRRRRGELSHPLIHPKGGGGKKAN